MTKDASESFVDDNDDDNATESSSSANYDILKDCLSTMIIEKLSPTNTRPSNNKKRQSKGRKNEIKPVERPKPTEEEVESDVAELGEFTEYLANEIFSSLPSDLRKLSYAGTQNDHDLAERYTLPLDDAILDAIIKPLPLSIQDSLTTYNLLNPPPQEGTATATISYDQSHHDFYHRRFISVLLTNYITSTTTIPPEHDPATLTTRATACEICDREHLPLTYHHLIPRQMHAKAVKRGWCQAWETDKVAWLCRACHSYVHKIASNEDLARDWASVERLLGREDVQRWAKWVGRVRWTAR